VDSRWKACYHYERIFGYEIRRCESFDHPDMLGVNPSHYTTSGYVKGGLLRQYKAPQPTGDEMQRRIWSITFPWKAPKEKDFSLKRKRAKNVKDLVHYTGYEDYHNPRIMERNLQMNRNPDFFLGNYQLPRWSDLQDIIFNQTSCGRTTKGRNPKIAANALRTHYLSKSPIDSWLNGGYDIITPFYKDRSLDEVDLLMYTALRNTSLYSSKVVEKVRPEESTPEFTRSGEGRSFIQQFVKDHTVSTFEVVVPELPTVYTEDTLDAESDHMIDLDDDEENIEIFSEDDDDDIVIITE
jgi:hypothetical protein